MTRINRQLSVGIFTLSLAAFGSSAAHAQQGELYVFEAAPLPELSIQSLDRELAQAQSTEVFRFDEQGFHTNPAAVTDTTRRIAERASRYLDLSRLTIG
jgi:hypothetical protein